MEPLGPILQTTEIFDVLVMPRACFGNVVDLLWYSSGMYWFHFHHRVSKLYKQLGRCHPYFDVPNILFTC